MGGAVTVETCPGRDFFLLLLGQRIYYYSHVGGRVGSALKIKSKPENMCPPCHVCVDSVCVNSLFTLNPSDAFKFQSALKYPPHVSRARGFLNGGA